MARKYKGMTIQEEIILDKIKELKVGRRFHYFPSAENKKELSKTCRELNRSYEILESKRGRRKFSCNFKYAQYGYLTIERVL